MRRFWAPALLLTSAGLSVPSCVAAPEASPIALRDPYGLIDDVVATGHDLRLYVVPSESYACNGNGTTSPVIPDLEVGAFPTAIVDITITPDTATDSARAEATVPAGSWTVLVRGKGTDPVSMIPNTEIATGCATVEMLGGGETRAVSITLQRVSGMGVCGDSILSPDEQCEAPGTLDCDAACQTTALPLNNQTTAGVQASPRLAARTGRRIATSFDARPDVGFRFLDLDGRSITTPGALERDRSLDLILGDSSAISLTGEQQTGTPAVAPDGRVAIPVTDFAMPADTDVRVVFLDENRSVLGGGAVALRMTRTMHQRRPVAAYTSTGALLIAFEDLASATGLSATHFAAGTTTATGEASPVGAASGAEPSLAGHDTGFVLAFSAGGDVFFQRLAADGTAIDATPRPVLSSAPGTQDQPVVAALSSGVFAVAFREGDVGSGDGAGSSIRARIFGADGTARGEAFVVNSTVAGDQASPAVAAADGEFTFAWQSGAEVRAAFYGENGTRLLNRERTPDAVDFVVGAGNATAPSVCAAGAGTSASWVIAWAAPADGAGDVLFRRYPN